MRESEKVNGPTDEVEGHMSRGKGYADESVQDDVEGHGAKIRFAHDEQPVEKQDDVEGHAGKFRFAHDEQPVEKQDDVEGHAIRGKGGLHDEPQGKDDVDGHAAKFRV